MNSKVLFDEDGWARLQAEVPKMKLVTPSALVERLKINGSLARAACKLLAKVRFIYNNFCVFIFTSSFCVCRRARSPLLRFTTSS
jgi:small subunit ribosomal protein S25e